MRRSGVRFPSPAQLHPISIPHRNRNLATQSLRHLRLNTHATTRNRPASCAALPPRHNTENGSIPLPGSGRSKILDVGPRTRTPPTCPLPASGGGGRAKRGRRGPQRKKATPPHAFSGGEKSLYFVPVPGTWYLVPGISMMPSHHRNTEPDVRPAPGASPPSSPRADRPGRDSRRGTGACRPTPALRFS